jgi:hypothetical protein
METSSENWVTLCLGRWIFVSQRTDKQGLGLFMAVSVHLQANFSRHTLTSTLQEIHRITQDRIFSLSHHQKPTYENSMLDQWLLARNTDGGAIPVADIEDQLLMDM